MPTNKELEKQLLELQDRVSALEVSGVLEASRALQASEADLDIVGAVIRALVITRSQGARFEAIRLAEKYFPGTAVDDFTSDKFTTSDTLSSATKE